MDAHDITQGVTGYTGSGGQQGAVAIRNLPAIIAAEAEDECDYFTAVLLEDTDHNLLMSGALVAGVAASASMRSADRSETTVRQYYEVTVPLYSPSEFKSHFRLSREAVQFVCEKLGACESRSMPVIPLEKKVQMTLWTLANPEAFRTVADRFGLTNRGTAHHCFIETCQRLKSVLYPDVVVWPSTTECRVIAGEFEARYGFPGVVGCIDGCHIPVKAPSADRDSFICRKGFPSVNLLAVCDHRKKFLFTYSDSPGSSHDANVLRASELGTKLLEDRLFLNEEHHLLGDAAYPLLPGMMVPFRDNGHLTPAQVRYNTVHSTARSVVERAFGLLKGKFRRLKSLDVTRIDLAPTIIDAACVLHNVCLSIDKCDDELVSDDAGGNDDDVDGELSARVTRVESVVRNKGKEKRNAIVNNL